MELQKLKSAKEEALEALLCEAKKPELDVQALAEISEIYSWLSIEQSLITSYSMSPDNMKIIHSEYGVHYNRRKTERNDLGEVCDWHTGSKSLQTYQGVPDKRSPLYKCVHLCDGYNPDCRTRQQMLEVGLLKGGENE